MSGKNLNHIPGQLKNIRNTAGRLLIKTMNADIERFVEHMSINRDELDAIAKRPDDERDLDEFVMRLAAEYAFANTLLILDKSDE